MNHWMSWTLIVVGAAGFTWLLVGPPGRALERYQKTLPKPWALLIDVIALTIGSTLGVLISR